MPVYVALTADMEEPGGDDTVRVQVLSAKNVREVKSTIGVPRHDEDDEGFLAYSIWPFQKLVDFIQDEKVLAEMRAPGVLSGLQTMAGFVDAGSSADILGYDEDSLDADGKKRWQDIKEACAWIRIKSASRKA